MVRLLFDPNEVLRSVKALLGKFENDIKDPSIRPLYQDGSKDEEIYDRTTPVTAMLSTLLQDRYALLDTPSDEVISIGESVEFLAEMYQRTVLSVVDLISLRNNDINSIDGSLESTHLNALFDALETELNSLINVPILDPLRNGLAERVNRYEATPFLQQRVANLLFERGGVYVIENPKPVNTYSTGDRIGSIVDPDGVPANVNASVAQKPAGLDVNPVTGEIFVLNEDDIVPGIYTFNIQTQDADGGTTIHLVTVQLEEDIAISYTVEPAKKLAQYAADDILASNDNPGGIVEAVLAAGELPLGTALDPATGTITLKAPTLLRPGNYPLVISIVDTIGKLQEHAISISVLQDEGYFYQVQLPRGEYFDGDVIAELNQSDNLVSAGVTEDMPAGMDINDITGEITVTNPALLVAGTYFVTVLSTNAENKEVVSSLTLTIGDATGKVLAYNVSTPQALDGYTNGDELAVVEDQGPPVVTYTELNAASFVSGALPPGTILDRANGKLIVSDITKLRAGLYAAQIRLVDIDGTSREVTLSVPIGDGATYSVAIARNVTSYLVGDVLATAQSSLGAITLASVSVGTRPDGTAINPATGEITVSDPSILPANPPAFTVDLTDESTAVTSVEVTLNFLADTLAQKDEKPDKSIGEFANNDVLVSFHDDDGPIIRATVTGGGLPPGTQMDPIDGTITVADTALLGPGRFSDIQIETEDIAGGITSHTVEINILPQVYFYYDLAASQDVKDYSDNDPLATLEPKPSPLQSVSIVSGVLPSGTKISGSTGDISVDTAADLAPGTFPLSIMLTDTGGGTSTIDITLVLLGAGATPPLPEGTIPLTVPAWDSLKAYTQNEITRFGNNLFISITNSNAGNQPDLVTTSWVEVSPASEFGKPWVADDYDLGAVVRNNDLLYECTVNPSFTSSDFAAELTAGQWKIIGAAGINTVLGLDNEVAADTELIFGGHKIYHTTGNLTIEGDDDMHINLPGASLFLDPFTDLVVDSSITSDGPIQAKVNLVLGDGPSALTLTGPAAAGPHAIAFPGASGTVALLDDVTTQIGNLEISDVLTNGQDVDENQELIFGDHKLYYSSDVFYIDGDDKDVVFKLNGAFVIIDADTNLLLQSGLTMEDGASVTGAISFKSVSPATGAVSITGATGSGNFNVELPAASGVFALLSDVTSQIGALGINEVLTVDNTVTVGMAFDEEVELNFTEHTIISRSDGLYIEGNEDLTIDLDGHVLLMPNGTSIDITGEVRSEDQGYFNLGLNTATSLKIGATNKVTLLPPASGGANITQTLPAQSGTIALLSDITGGPGAAGIEDVLNVDGTIQDDTEIAWTDLSLVHDATEGLTFTGNGPLTVNLSDTFLISAGTTLEIEGDLSAQGGEFASLLTARTTLALGTTNKVTLSPPASGGANIAQTLPATNGTLALLSDVTTAVGGLTADDITPTTDRNWLTDQEQTNIADNTTAQGKVFSDATDTTPDYFANKIGSIGDVVVKSVAGGLVNLEIERIQNKAIPVPLVKGDLWVFDGNDMALLSPGDAGAILVADPTQDTGWKSVQPAMCSFTISDGLQDIPTQGNFTAVSVGGTSSGTLVVGTKRRVLDVIVESDVVKIHNTSGKPVFVAIHCTGNFEYTTSGVDDTRFVWINEAGIKVGPQMQYPISSVIRALAWHAPEIEIAGGDKIHLAVANDESAPETLSYDLAVSVRDIEY